MTTVPPRIMIDALSDSRRDAGSDARPGSGADTGAGIEQACSVPETRGLVRDLFTMTADKWSMLVIRALEDGPLRFTDLMKAVDGVSHRMLTRTVRGLQRDGMLSRTSYPESPPRVEYALTPLGVTLLEPVRAFVAWTHEHEHEIIVSRARYDG
ncbi:winged helix-turn-helix transcriptional regulator [Herbiconiux daphne]|uniref:Helix-turn-helix transcriptional regulator n=1 Tax=Herbiconiux daphne TaxID=2970914 RepID=A0ABT2H520_9MICO|nr:helix-turn-helix domain-containing protein [Herbiconiux daphne]MCS5734993.1 helix-turn-helix transcriptional regulator [Herbiconiux daphne]